MGTVSRNKKDVRVPSSAGIKVKHHIARQTQIGLKPRRKNMVRLLACLTLLVHSIVAVNRRKYCTCSDRWSPYGVYNWSISFVTTKPFVSICTCVNLGTIWWPHSYIDAELVIIQLKLAVLWTPLERRGLTTWPSFWINCAIIVSKKHHWISGETFFDEILDTAKIIHLKVITIDKQAVSWLCLLSYQSYQKSGNAATQSIPDLKIDHVVIIRRVPLRNWLIYLELIHSNCIYWPKVCSLIVTLNCWPLGLLKVIWATMPTFSQFTIRVHVSDEIEFIIRIKTAIKRQLWCFLGTLFPLLIKN